MTTTSFLPSKPSISTRSWLSVWSYSRLAAPPERAVPTASSSSMKMIAGACLRASLNRRRMRAEPRPANISTNDEADWEKNVAPDSWATALASSVLPVPGGPCRRIPAGRCAPRVAEALGVAHVVDDLAQLGLGLVGARDVVPGDRRRRLRADLRGLGPGDQPHRHEHQDDEQPHEDQRHPVVDPGDEVGVAEERAVEHASGDYRQCGVAREGRWTSCRAGRAADRGE